MPLNVSSIEVLARDDPRGFTIAPHAHGEHQIVHASRGIMRVITEVSAWVVPPGRALWMPARTVHWINCVTDVSMRTVYLQPDAAPRAPHDCVVWAVSGLMREVILRLVEGAPDDAQQRLLVALLVSEIEAADLVPLSLPMPRDRRLTRVTDALQAAPGNDRSLADWARIAGASPRTLMRLFLKETGLSFREWRRQARLLAALERLAQGEAVTTVALDLGYASPSAFIQAFREVLGVTPARYFDR
jgi:AraC-like DNA-binding protein